ncbi:MAG TPA: FecR domain-containing protein [Candidatus Brocadiia bacterium]|nr:FecR domain-containing protein [Candidatus Brocadiia bacterium]
MSCAASENLREELADLVMGTADPARAEVLRVHAAGCGDCRAALARMERAWNALGRWRLEEPAPAERLASAVWDAAHPKPRYFRFCAGLAAAAAAFYVVFAVLPALAAQRERERRMALVRPSRPLVVAGALARPLDQGAMVDAPDDGADVRLPDGSILFLAGGSRLKAMETEDGKRFVCALIQGELEAQVEPGEPLRVYVPGGWVETIGTRFVVKVRGGPETAAAAMVATLDGRVRLSDGLGVCEVARGEQRTQAVFGRQGSLCGRVTGSGERPTLSGPVMAWRVASRELGDVWVHWGAEAPAAPSGKWARIAYEARDGLAWAARWEALDGPPGGRDCADEGAVWAVVSHARRMERFRTLSLSNDAEAVMAAARELAREVDVLAAPRVERARARMAKSRPDVAAALEAVFAALPAQRIETAPAGAWKERPR